MSSRVVFLLAEAVSKGREARTAEPAAAPIPRLEETGSKVGIDLGYAVGFEGAIDPAPQRLRLVIREDDPAQFAVYAGNALLDGA